MLLLRALACLPGLVATAALAWVPFWDAIVLETDAPDMAPAMYPNQRNSPQHLPEICQALAHVMGISAEHLAEATTANACEVFGWPQTCSR